MAQPLPDDLQELPCPRRGDALDRVPGELPVADREVAVQPDLLALVARLDDGAPEAELELLGLALGEPEPDADVVGEMAPAHRDDARRVGRAVAVEHVVGRPRADVDRQHAVLALLHARDHVAGGEAREDKLAHLEVESPDDVDVVGEPLLLPVHGPVADLELLAHEVLRRRRNQPPVDPERPADVVDHHPAEREVLGLRQVADRPDVVHLDHVVGRLHVDGSLVVEPLEVAPGLRQVDMVDPLVGVALGDLEGVVGALGRGPVVDDRSLDHAPARSIRRSR